MAGKKERPKSLTGKTVRLRTSCGNLYLTVNFNTEKEPVEILARLGKSGACAATFTDALARVCSIALRAGVEAKEITSVLKGHSCNSAQRCESTSCADAIGIGIEQIIEAKE